MNTEIDEGITLINMHDNGDYNIQYSKQENLHDIMFEIKEFLLACGFSEKAINEYIYIE